MSHTVLIGSSPARDGYDRVRTSELADSAQRGPFKRSLLQAPGPPAGVMEEATEEA